MDNRPADQVVADRLASDPQLSMEVIPKAPCVCCSGTARVDSGPLCGYCWRRAHVNRGRWPLEVVCHNSVWTMEAP